MKIAISIAFALCAFAWGMAAFATNKPPAKPPTPIVITETEHDLRGAIVTGVVMYFVMRHRAKKHRPLVLVPAEPVTCPTVTDERLERVLELCGK